jgi:hypothetical protein
MVEYVSWKEISIINLDYYRIEQIKMLGLADRDDPTINIIIVDLRLVIRSKCCYEKNRYAHVIVVAISLSTSFILLVALHFFAYVYANLLLFVPMLPPSLQALCLSHTLCLYLSVSLLSFPPLPSHIKTKIPWQPFPFIIDCNKVI